MESVDNLDLRSKQIQRLGVEVKWWRRWSYDSVVKIIRVISGVVSVFKVASESQSAQREKILERKKIWIMGVSTHSSGILIYTSDTLPCNV